MNTTILQIDYVRDNHLYILREQHKVNLSELVLLVAEINYTHLHLRSGKKITVAKTLKTFEDILSNYHFYRIHRTFLINFSHLKSYNSELGEVMMTNNYKATTSRRRKNIFEVQINSSINKKAMSV
jgi:two-component system, LytTR family, response regulator